MPQKIQPMDVDGAPEFMDADGAPEFEQDTDSLDADGAPEFEQGTDSLGGADLFIEQVDHIWVKAGAAVLLVLTLLVPFAVVFGVNILLWVWWGMGAAVYISLRLMRYTNDSLSSQPDHVLLMLLIVTVRYPFLWSVSVQGHTWLRRTPSPRITHEPQKEFEPKRTMCDEGALK